MLATVGDDISTPPPLPPLPVMIRRTADGRHCLQVDEAWRRFTGRPGDEAMGLGWTEILHPDDRDPCLERLQAVVAGRETGLLPYRARRSDGTYRWLQEQVLRLDAGEGASGGLMHVAVDVTELRVREQALEERLERQRLLLDEARHRFRNHFQMIISLLRLQASGSDDPGVHHALDRAATRVETLALAARQTEAMPDARTLRLDHLLEELIDAHRAMLEAEGVSLVVECPPVEVRAELGIPLALLGNEVLLNAARHAFPGDRRGTIRVSGSAAGHELEVLVADDGVGLPADVADGRRQGSGLRLVHALATQLDARLMIERQLGTSILLTIPADRWRVAEPAAPLDGSPAAGIEPAGA